MKKQTIVLFLLFYLSQISYVFSQDPIVVQPEEKISKLFRSSKIFPIKLNYSNKEIRKSTNDTLYLNVSLQYLSEKKLWTGLPARIRARGNFRLKNCYFAPIKMKIKKKDRKGTPFKGNKELKLVLPCLIQKEANDHVLKEFMAYKLYEFISPYHFKTRLLEIELSEPKNNKIREHNIKGFFIEDMEVVAKRFNGNVLKRNIHPLQQDGLSAVQNAIFQFMIGNTDFSTGYSHNEKLLFVDGKSIPIPYDFDMSGLCNTSYSVVSQIGDQSLPIDRVTQRLYRGFKRDEEMVKGVRDEILSKKAEILAMMDEHLIYFDDPKVFFECRNFILEFFGILSDPIKFQKQILKKARTK